MATKNRSNRARLSPAGEDTPATAESAQALADAFIRDALGEGRVRLRLLDRLCAMATHHDPEVARAGVQALYATIVEGLCDDFSDTGVRTCNLVLLRVLSFVTGQPDGREIAAALAPCGPDWAEALLRRYERLRTPRPLPAATREQVRKAVVLSRVSAGADVAVTSVIVQRLLAALPRAEIVLAGPGHLEDFFAGHPRLRCLRLDYPRQGGPLADRFAHWPRLAELIAREAEGLENGQLLLFDPDTRLSQLGLLPVMAEGQTWYFSSRTNPMTDREPSLPELANVWLDRVLAAENPAAPRLFLPAGMMAAARDCCARLRERGAEAVLVVNLGVGNNPRKRLPGPFEEELLAALLKARGKSVILLDTGGDSEEKERILSLVAAMGRQGFPIGSLAQEEMAGWHPPFAHGVIGFDGSLGALAALISQADGFCGYDSCGQHLAGAVGTPAVIVFAGAPNPRFFARWRSPVPTTATVRVEAPPAAASERAGLIEAIVSRLHSPL